jgi:serine/threonine protein kinase
MTISITLVERNGRVLTKVFEKDELTLGRSSGNDICPDPILYNQVSRRHGRVLRAADRYYYEDLGSTQGSWYEGHELKERLVLRRGDVVTLGKDGPSIAIDWPQERITGREGTHLKIRLKTSPSFPLAFSEAFRGKYSSYERLAAGGFGEVWKGIPVDGGPTVAIKLMHPQLLDPGALHDDDRVSLISRFAREARLTHQLSQTGAASIPRVHHWGDDADRDYLYIVMELIEGVSFDHIINPRQPLTVARVATIMYQVAQALDVAHNFQFTDDNGLVAYGVIHRDIKPNNILLDPATDRTWVVDFGVAGFQEGGERLTSTNITVGTYQFLPLEAIEQSKVGPSTDLWGMVVTMYIALSGGRFPFYGGERGDLLRVLRNGDFLPMTTYRADVPAPLISALYRSLNTDPKLRIQSAAEWMKILRPYSAFAENS